MDRSIKFINKTETDFFNVLRKRVDDHFIHHNRSAHANSKMVVKTIVMLSLYFVPYFLILSGTGPSWIFWLNWIIMGTGLAGIGMSVMHDANHKAYSSNNTVNTLIGYTLNLVGGDAFNWKMQHNILHHTYTNIHPADEDINNKPGLRFSPAGTHKPGHNYQFIYAFFLYTLLTLFWVLLKDIVQFFRYVRNGMIKAKGWQLLKHFSGIVLWKVFYLSYILVLPMTLLDRPAWHFITGFLIMHAIGGLILSLVFQLAHVVESTTYPVPNEQGNMDNEWAVHQLMTTADFATDNPFLTYYLGGLNFQVIHHLFPRICHVHYPEIAPIVARTAQEFNLPYTCYPTFGSALRSHISMLKKLGRHDYSHLIEAMG